MIAVALLAWCGIGGLIGYAIGNAKGQAVFGFWMGFFFGVIGWVVVAFAQPSDEVRAQRDAAAIVLRAQVAAVEGQRVLRPCPYCAEMIQPAAVLCRYCGRDVEPMEAVLPDAPDPDHEARMAALMQRFPRFMPAAQAALASRPAPPADDLAWLEKVCLELRKGLRIEKAVDNVDGPSAEAGWY